MVVCADDPKLQDKLDQAVEKGELVEVTQIHDVVPNMLSFQS